MTVRDGKAVWLAHRAAVANFPDAAVDYGLPPRDLAHAYSDFLTIPQSTPTHS